jgi:Protein of unknown function (DUF3237)
MGSFLSEVADLLNIMLLIQKNRLAVINLPVTRHRYTRRVWEPTYSGYNHANAKNFAMISAGKGSELSPSDYYFRTSVSFETSSPRYAWLNHTVAIGVGRFPAAGKVSYRIYAIK